MSIFNLLFLGTCACDYSPKLKEEYKDKFDKDARRSSSIIIDGKYLVDCGPHTLDSLRIAGVERTNLTALFITHTHDDHFDEKNVQELVDTVPNLRIYINENADINIQNAEIIKMKTFTPYCCEDMTVTSYPANHRQETAPQHYLFEKSGKKIFYALDGALFLHQTYYALVEKEFDTLVLDCTTGDYEGDYRLCEHNSIPLIRLMLPSMKTVRMITADTQVYLSHLAPSLHKSHDETVKICEKFGAKVAYDGLKIDI
ncbi:MAG: MBL fold metallo-hydrolase [Clostridia bacterium]|nr:MBL fold metallo-hydrolase [Clostridia bacterium]